MMWLLEVFFVVIVFVLFLIKVGFSFCSVFIEYFCFGNLFLFIIFGKKMIICVLRFLWFNLREIFFVC